MENKNIINEELARSAHYMSHMGDYRVNSATDNFNSYVAKFNGAVKELLEKNSKTKYPATPEQLEAVEYYKARYATKLANAINRENQIETMCPSVLISGAGNFPVHKKHKQNAARDKFWQECGSLYSPTENYYFKKIETILTNATIYSNDEFVIEKLENKIQELEEYQATSKRQNAYYRKNGTMKGFEDIDNETALSIDRKIESDFPWCKQPVPSYSLSNNSAEIRRLKERLENLKKLKAQAEMPIEDKYPNVDGVEVKENSEAMRIQLFFDGKPDDETRSLLKSNGFKWSPSFGAWQRQLTNNGIYATKQVLKILKEKGGE